MLDVLAIPSLLSLLLKGYKYAALLLQYAQLCVPYAALHITGSCYPIHD